MINKEEHKKETIEDRLKKMSLKEKIDFYFDDLDTFTGKMFDFVVIFLIIVLSITYVISTYDLPQKLNDIIDTVEFVIIIIFLIEYVLRMWVAKHKINHFFNIYSLIDLVSIVPFFFTFSNLQFVRIFRVIRVFRVLRFLRFLKDEYFFFGTVREDNLIIARIIFILLAIIFVSSSLIYHVEHAADQTKITNFFDAVYFTIVTLTTVGFGDLTPVTFGGKLVTILMILSGVIFLPWQIGTLIKKFISTSAKENVVCPSCGLKYHDKDAVHCKACGSMIYQEYESDI